MRISAYSSGVIVRQLTNTPKSTCTQIRFAASKIQPHFMNAAVVHLPRAKHCKSLRLCLTKRRATHDMCASKLHLIKIVLCRRVPTRQAGWGARDVLATWTIGAHRNVPGGETRLDVGCAVGRERLVHNVAGQALPSRSTGCESSCHRRRDDCLGEWMCQAVRSSL